MIVMIEAAILAIYIHKKSRREEGMVHGGIENDLFFFGCLNCDTAQFFVPCVFGFLFYTVEIPFGDFSFQIFYSTFSTY